VAGRDGGWTRAEVREPAEAPSARFLRLRREELQRRFTAGEIGLEEWATLSNEMYTQYQRAKIAEDEVTEP
jgi:hypothetical protein